MGLGILVSSGIVACIDVVGRGPKEPAPVSRPPESEPGRDPEVAGTSQGLVETVYPMTEEEAKALNEKGIEGVVGLLEHLKSLSVAEQYDEGKDPVVFKATDEGGGGLVHSLYGWTL